MELFSHLSLILRLSQFVEPRISASQLGLVRVGYEKAEGFYSLSERIYNNCSRTSSCQMGDAKVYKILHSGNILQGRRSESQTLYTLDIFALLGCYVKHSKKNSSWTARPLKMGLTGCPETSVTTNKRPVTPQRNEYLICIAAEA